MEPAGELEGSWLGEFQLETVAGDVAGESSDLRLRFVDARPTEAEGGGGIASRAAPEGFLRCWRCFSSMLRRPSFVKGLGRTSFMPDGDVRRQHLGIEGETDRAEST